MDGALNLEIPADLGLRMVLAAQIAVELHREADAAETACRKSVKPCGKCVDQNTGRQVIPGGAGVAFVTKDKPSSKASAPLRGTCARGNPGGSLRPSLISLACYERDGAD